MAYQSNLPNVRERMRAARDAGLIAAAEVLKGAVRDGLRGGYVSGDFVTGHVMNSVQRTEPFDQNGVRGIRVFSDVDYALYYEVGHINLFRRQYTRKEVWAPTMLRTTPDQLAAFERVFVRFMAA